MSKSSDDQPIQARRSLIKKIGFGLLATVLILALLEGLVSGVRIIVDVVRISGDSPRVVNLKEDSHCQYDEEIGWINIPGTQIEDFYAPGHSITINADGVRGLTDYGAQDRGKYRMICLGDSFTLGYGVDDRQTFPYLLEQTQPDRIEVVNMGQGGYSVGQDYLWLKRLGPKLKPDLVVCTFIVEDFRRLATTRTANGYAAPRFETDGKKIVVSNQPVPEKLAVGDSLASSRKTFESVRKHSALADSMALLFEADANSDDFQSITLGLLILDEVHSLCSDWECPLMLVLIPTIPEVFSGESIAQYKAASELIKTYADSRSIPFLDLQPVFFATEQNEALFLNEQFQHYSRRGNQLVAEQLAEWLPKVVDGYPEILEE